MDKIIAKTRIPVTLTGEQHESLTRAAEKVGLTISAYIRMVALEKANTNAD